MGIMPAFVAIFPDAVVWLSPMLANVLSALTQHFLHFAIETIVFADEMRNGFDHFSVNIQLYLLARPIPDSDWTRIGVPIQVGQLAFWRRKFAKNIIHDEQFWPGQASRVQEPINESLR